MRWGKAFLAAVFVTGMFTSSAKASWVIGGDIGTGIPTGTFSDAWSSGFYGSLSATYSLNPRFAIGADISHASFGTTDDYQALLDFIDPGASDDFTVWRYGVHGRWMVPLKSAKLAPYVGVGMGMYSMKDKYESPTISDELTQTVFGLRGGLGCDYWLSPKIGLGIAADYNKASTSEDEIGYDSTPFYTVAAGVRWRLTPSK